MISFMIFMVDLNHGLNGFKSLDLNQIHPAKTSSIRSVVSTEHRLVRDGQTDGHRPMASTADA